ncbi:hypothetical protein COO60DRAFT_1462232 [Scenedesmus sp. NREL 46B-D3]|nr:hypothetical protein COO60DRAFT_1462232 [Scenedesmus sp. NREL 46B-D3]
MSKEQGRNCFVPTAAQPCRRGQPVGWFSGTLQEKDKACRVLRRLDVSRHLWFYDIPASALGDYGYTGPDLVLDMLDRGSELRVTHDAKWHKPNSSNNIAALFWMLPMQLADGSTLAIPHIFGHAQQHIRKGGELLLDWGDECWAAYHQTQVGARRIVVFDPDEEQFELHSLNPSSYLSSSSKEEEGSEEDKGSEDGGESAAGQESVKSEESGIGEEPATPAAPPLHEAFAPVGNLQLQQQPACQLQSYLLQRFDGVQVAGGYNSYLLQVVDVVSVHHPASCSVLSTEIESLQVKFIILRHTKCTPVDIKRGEPIIDYVGVAYCLSVRCKDLLLAYLPLKQHQFMHDLVIDSMEVGNENRFINCKWAREKLPDGRPHLNCIARVVWVESRKRPAVRLFATRCIKVGEEIVADYGPDYWVAMGRSLQVDTRYRHLHAAAPTKLARCDVLYGHCSRVRWTQTQLCCVSIFC